MTNGRVPWSWLALAVSALPLGGVMMFGMYITQMFRQGMDADMSLYMFSISLDEYLASIAFVGVVLTPLTAAGVWLANLSASPRRMVWVLVPTLGVLLFVGTQAWGVGGLSDYLSTFDYPPRWMELVAMAAAGLASVWGYLRTIAARTVPASA